METSSANFIQAYFIKRMQWVSVIFVMFYIKSPAPFFRHPPRGHTNTAPDTATPVLGKGRGDVCIVLYHEEETPPPLFFRYPLTPYHSGSTSGPLTPSR